MSFGSRLRDKREELGMKQSDLGKLLGVTGSAIGNYENGISSPKADILYRVFDVLQCDANYLFQDEIKERREYAATSDEMENLIKKYRALDEYGKEAVDSIVAVEYKRCSKTTVIEREPDSDAEEKPVYIRHYLAPAAAGYANPVEGSDYEDIPLPPGAPDWADFSIDISGDSMEPYIKDGSTIYVERDVSLQDFDVGVFYLDGDIFIKQFAPSYDGSVYLLSANPKREDANKFISKDSGSTLICYGKAILPRRLPAPNYN